MTILLGIDPGFSVRTASLGVAVLSLSPKGVLIYKDSITLHPEGQTIFDKARSAETLITRWFDGNGLHCQGGAIERCDFTKSAKVVSEINWASGYLAGRFSLVPYGASEWQGSAKGGAMGKDSSTVILLSLGLVPLAVYRTRRRGATLATTGQTIWKSPLDLHVLTEHELDAVLIAEHHVRHSRLRGR